MEDQIFGEVAFAQLCGGITAQKEWNGTPKGSLFISINGNRKLKETAFLRAGVDENSVTPTFYVMLTSQIRKFIEDNMIYPIIGNGEDARNDYFLEVTGNNCLYVKYQQIIGSRKVMELDDDQISALATVLAAQLSKFAEKTIAKSPLVVIGGTVDNELLSQIKLMRAEGQRIVLPTEHLSRYQEIKSMMIKAHGKYNQKGYFEFPAGVTPTAILDAILSGEKINGKKASQSFFTPAGLAKELCRSINSISGMRVLEPSAGNGALADVIVEMGGDVTLVENYQVNIEALKAKGYEPIEKDFLTLTPEEIGLFDVIVANPPFTKDQDIKHVMHMWDFLAPGGEIAVIMSNGWKVSDRKAHREFRGFLAANGASIVDVPAGAFKESGTTVATTRIKMTKMVGGERFAIAA